MSVYALCAWILGLQDCDKAENEACMISQTYAYTNVNRLAVRKILENVCSPPPTTSVAHTLNGGVRQSLETSLPRSHVSDVKAAPDPPQLAIQPANIDAAPPISQVSAWSIVCTRSWHIKLGGLRDVACAWTPVLCVSRLVLQSSAHLMSSGNSRCE